MTGCWSRFNHYQVIVSLHVGGVLMRHSPFLNNSELAAEVIFKLSDTSDMWNQHVLRVMLAKQCLSELVETLVTTV